MTVYVDILLFLNFYIDYLIIRLSLCFLKMKVKTYKTVLASAFAAITSLTIFLPQNIIIELASKFITAFIIALILNGVKNIIKLSSVLILVAAVFNGMFLLLGKTVLEKRLITINGSTYFDISLLTFGIASTIVYIILKLFSRLFANKTQTDFKVRIYQNENIVELDGFCDSGNKLTDYLSGKSVIICPKDRFCGNLKIMRLLPYNTINSEGFVNIIKPEKIEFIYADGKITTPDALIGLSENNKTNKAVVNPTLIY